MREKEMKLYHGITKIDERFLEEAKEKEEKRRFQWRKWAAAACLCAAAVTAAVVCHSFFMQKKETSISQKMREGSFSSDVSIDEEQGDTEAYSAGNDESFSDKILEEEYSAAEPVLYSALSLPKGKADKEALALSDNMSMADIRAFDESLLKKDSCCMIIEGTVTDLYVKHYEYDIYDDKFEKDGVLHSFADTVVYEIEIEKNWYGEKPKKKTILVEDDFYCTEPVLGMKKGMRYVLPLYEYGDQIMTLDIRELADGDIKRESYYSTIDPYHPQITVTEDGYYLVPEGWETLTAADAREVIMDTIEEGECSWKMYLVDRADFTKQMAVLLSNLHMK